MIIFIKIIKFKVNLFPDEPFFLDGGTLFINLFFFN